MPYATIADLPQQVRNSLPSDAQSRFRAVVNDALQRGLSDSKAFASAWSVVRNGWEPSKDGEGKWRRKPGLDKAERTLYVRRDLINGEDLVKWAKGQGFTTTVPPEQMHVTIAYSKKGLEWPQPSTVDKVVVKGGGSRTVEALGDKGATVLRFDSSALQSRWDELRKAGASWDFPSYKPHVTVSWDAKDVDLSKVEPYDGPLEFGPEVFEEIDEDWMDNLTEKIGARHTGGEYKMLQDMHDLTVKLGASCQSKEPMGKADIVKTDEEQRMVYGWASVISKDGEPIIDTQGDVISAEDLVKGTTDFMEDARLAKAMHDGGQIGEVLHSFPLTAELAKGLGIDSRQEGWIVGVKVHDDGIWKRVKSGELKAFSIGAINTRQEMEA